MFEVRGFPFGVRCFAFGVIGVSRSGIAVFGVSRLRFRGSGFSGIRIRGFRGFRFGVSYWWFGVFTVRGSGFSAFQLGGSGLQVCLFSFWVSRFCVLCSGSLFSKFCI